MRCSLASMRRVAIGSLAAIILASTNAAAEPKYCGNGLWYPDGVCPTVQMIPPQPQGPTKEQHEQEQLRQQQIRNEQLRQQQIRNEQLRQEAFTKAEGAGISAYRRGDYQAAIEYFERALEHSPYNPVIKHDIERAREKLAEKNASRLSAGSSRAFDQLSAIANNSRAAVQAPRSHYSADIGGTGAPNQARGGFDSAASLTSIPFGFTKYLEPGADPIVLPRQRTPRIRALEQKRDSARSQAMNLEIRRRASTLPTATAQQEHERPQVVQREKEKLQEVDLLDLGIEKELHKK